MGDQLEFVDDNADVRLAGSLLDPGATEGDVLTVQADGSVAAQTGGGSSFAGWTADGSDPANVSTNGGELAMGAANITGLSPNPSGADTAVSISFVDKLLRNVVQFSGNYTTGGIVVDQSGTLPVLAIAQVSNNDGTRPLVLAVSLNDPTAGSCTVIAYVPDTGAELANGTPVSFSVFSTAAGAG